jgi:DNA-binding NarL/FixJ family response regulator
VVRGIAQGLGGLVLSPSIADKLLVEFREPPRRTTSSPSLTERELEVLKLVSEGYANHEIAEALHLSPHTVKRHVANILAKLQQRSRLEAVMHAIRSGVLVADAS